MWPDRKRLRLILIIAIVVGGIVAPCHLILKEWWHSRRVERRIDRYSNDIWKQAQANALPTELLRAIIRVESGGKPLATSNRGAKGLMQITPVAEKEVLERLQLPRGDLFDPTYNILIGTTYLRKLVDRFDGDLYLAVAAYHAGPTRMQEICRATPTREGRAIVLDSAPQVTRNYCRKVLGKRSVQLGSRSR